MLLFASVACPLTQTNETSLASSSTSAKRRSLVVPAPPDMPAVAETLLDVGAVSPFPRTTRLRQTAADDEGRGEILRRDRLGVRPAPAKTLVQPLREDQREAFAA